MLAVIVLNYLDQCAHIPSYVEDANLTVRYGARPIEFAPGNAEIAVGKKEKLISTLETVIAAVEAGELDGVLVQMSKSAVMTKGKRAA